VRERAGLREQLGIAAGLDDTVRLDDRTQAMSDHDARHSGRYRAHSSLHRKTGAAGIFFRLTGELSVESKIIARAHVGGASPILSVWFFVLSRIASGPPGKRCFFFPQALNYWLDGWHVVTSR
jgi:hypothetical protein